MRTWVIWNKKDDFLKRRKWWHNHRLCEEVGTLFLDNWSFVCDRIMQPPPPPPKHTHKHNSVNNGDFHSKRNSTMIKVKNFTALAATEGKMLSNINSQESCPCAHHQGTFLTLALDWHVWSASCPSCFSPEDRTHSRHPLNRNLGGPQGQGARELSCPCRELNHNPVLSSP
jgi:hypothetical protein